MLFVSVTPSDWVKHKALAMIPDTYVVHESADCIPYYTNNISQWNNQRNFCQVILAS